MTSDLSVWTALLAFTGAAGLLTIVPGLDTMLVLRTATVEGPRRAMFAGLGICTGCLIWGVLVSLGLGAVFSVSNFAYHLLRIIGAGYLVYLGIRLLRQREPAQFEEPDQAAGLQQTTGAARWFARGLLTNLLNPKVGVFYVTFLPQFIPAGVNVVGFSVLLALIHDVEGILWFAALTLATQPLVRWLRRPKILTLLNRLTGGIFILFGVRLALERKT
jgi:RhtB (resistance to homoserine/threonine) family protein